MKSENRKIRNDHLRKAIEENKKKHYWMKWMSVLCAFVLMLTTITLIFPASTMSDADDVTQTEGTTLAAEDEKSEAAVEVKYTEDAAIPDGSAVTMTEITGDKKQELLAKAREELNIDSSVEIDGRFFDIAINNNGTEVEPKSDVDVKVSLSDEKLKDVVNDKDNQIQVVHFKDDDQAVAVESDNQVINKKDNTETADVTFKADSFSAYGFIYTVDFHNGDYTYSIDGESSIKLSDVMSKININDFDVTKVTDVSFSNTDLVSVQKDTDDNDWTLTSLKPFQTEELLTVEMNDGSKYEIKVTDDSAIDFGSCITSINAFQRNSNNSDWDSTPVIKITDGEKVKFDIDYKMGANTITANNKTVQYNIPSQIQLSEATSGDVTDPENPKIIIGTYTIDQQGYLTITFNDKVDPQKETTGTISFNGTVSSSKGTDDDTFKFDGTDKTYTIEVPDSKKYDIATAKSGNVSEENPDAGKRTGTYSVTISSEKGTGTYPVTIGDYIDHYNTSGVNSITYDTNSLVIKKVASDGTETTLNGSEYTTDWSKNSWDDNDKNAHKPQFSVTGLPALGPGEKYIATYSTIIDPVKSGDGYGKVANKAWSDFIKSPTESSVTNDWKQKVSKYGNYDQNTDLINWTVTINEQKENLNGYKFSDELPAELANGADRVTLVPDGGGDSITVSVEDGKIEHTFSADDRNMYTINYSTKAPATDGSVTNTAKLGTYQASKEVPVVHEKGSQGKEVRGFGEEDTTTHTVPAKWKIYANLPYGSHTSYEVIDTIGESDDELHYGIASEIQSAIESRLSCSYVDSRNTTQYAGYTNFKSATGVSFNVIYYDKDGNEIAKNDTSSKVKSFKITIKKADDTEFSNVKSISIDEYSTRLDVSNLEAGTSLTASNTFGDVTKTQTYTKTSNDISKETYDKDQYGNAHAQKNNTVSYGANNKTLTYKITIHPSSHKDATGMETNQTLTLTDELPGGLTYTGNAEAKFSDGNTSASEYLNGIPWTTDFTNASKPMVTSSVNDKGNTILTITIPNYYHISNKDGVCIYYSLSYENDTYWNNLTNTEKTYINTATFDGIPSSANETVQREAKNFAKTGVQAKSSTGSASNVVDYSVVINSAGANLTSGDTLTLTDQMVQQYNQNSPSDMKPVLSLDTVKLYEYHADQENPIGNEIPKNRYKVVYDDKTFTLTVTVPDECACILKYSYTIKKDLTNGGTVSNKVALTGQTAEVVNTSLANVSSSATGLQKSIKFIKVDSENYNVVLPGTKFRIDQFSNSNDSNTEGVWIAGSEQAADENGMITYNASTDHSLENDIQFNTLYRLVETQPTAGYESALNTTVKYFVWLNEGSSKDSVYGSIAGANKPSESDIDFIESNGGTFYIPNTYSGIRVNKVWLDENGNGLADTNTPESVTVKLFAKNNDGTKTEVTADKNRNAIEALTLNKQNNWSAQWTNLPEGTYVVEESKVAGFDVSYSANNTAGISSGTITVTNQKLPTTDFTFSKQWFNGSSQITWPNDAPSINLTLTGKKTGESDVTYSLVATKDALTAGENTTLPGNASVNADGNTYTYTVTGLPSGYTYSIVEAKANGYKAPEYLDADGNSLSETDQANGAGNNQIIKNAKEVAYTLPNTGSTGTLPYKTAGSAMIALAVAGYAVKKRKHRKADENQKGGAE